MLLSCLMASNTVVAMELAMSPRSGRTHQHDFCRKCGCKNLNGGSFLVMVISSGSGLVILKKMVGCKLSGWLCDMQVSFSGLAYSTRGTILPQWDWPTLVAPVEEACSGSHLLRNLRWCGSGEEPFLL